MIADKRSEFCNVKLTRTCSYVAVTHEPIVNSPNRTIKFTTGPLQPDFQMMNLLFLSYSAAIVQSKAGIAVAAFVCDADSRNEVSITLTFRAHSKGLYCNCDR